MTRQNRIRHFRCLDIHAIVGLAWCALCGGVQSAEPQKIEANRVAEVALVSEKVYQNPFQEIVLDAIVARPDGKQLRIPAFWAGGNRWCFRYSSPKPGKVAWRTECSDRTNLKLHGAEGTIEVVPYAGDNPLYRHGPIRVAQDHRHFGHADGTPFFWLGDTWWKGLCKRLTWKGFQELTADRKAKGFSVVQIIGGGPYPDEPPFDPRWANEGGMPYEKNFVRINPVYFDHADRRIECLIDAGIMPAIVGGWGWHMPAMGVEKMDRHWRYLIARYGAFPVVWIVAGEMQEARWVEVARFVRKVDPYHRLATIHPPGIPELQSGRKALNVELLPPAAGAWLLTLGRDRHDDTLLDFDLLQTAHNDWATAPITVSQVTSSHSKTPAMPVVDGEVVYEWHKREGRHDVQRFMFWSCMLCGAAGHTYGAGGIWEMNSATVRGSDYDDPTWSEAMRFPGSSELGLGKKLLEEYPWWRFAPHPEWVEPHSTTLFQPHTEWYDNHQKWRELHGRWDLPYAAGIPGEVRFVYIPAKNSYELKAPTVLHLEPGINYRAFLFDPVWGRRFDLGLVKKSATSSRPPDEYQPPQLPSPQDWVLVLERVTISAQPTTLTVARQPLAVQPNRIAEVTLTTDVSYSNPFQDVTLDALVTAPDGRQFKLPAFWAGGNVWRFRYASGLLGTHTYRTECSDRKNPRLHGVEGKIEVVPYVGDNPLYRHGPVRVSKDRRHFAHADGTPFFWLADTWWKGLCKRLTWEGFQELTADRKAKGFSVVQIVCGSYPDEGMFVPGWENEGGKPYATRDFSVVNPAYFEYADRRIKHLVDAGIVPAIVGSWGRPDCDGMKMAGVAGIKRNWRNLVARYGAYPVVWIVGGEIPEETRWGQGPWGEAAKYLRGIDPFHRPTTVHAGAGRRDGLVVDFDMVGGSHDGWDAVTPRTLSILTSACAKTPPMPVLCGETAYEGHMQQNLQDVQRHVFWMYMLNGAAGHTYGAAGVWQAGVDGDPGIRPIYDWTTWREGMNYPGSRQLGLGKKLLERYAWWRFEPHPEWAEAGCYAAGIPREVRFIYLPRRGIYNWNGPLVKNLEPDVSWHAYYFDPATGRQFDQGTVPAMAGDKAAKPVDFKRNLPSPQDWVLVLERARPHNVVLKEPLPDRFPSPVPRQLFSGTLADQEKELETNALMLRFAESRQKLAADRYRPVYHFVSPESQMNDPNGLCFWQGRWHLFYQAYPPDEFPSPANIPKRRQHWGHAVSDDLVHWRDLPYAIYPGIERMCFSGSTLVEEKQVVAFYPGIGAGQMVAVSKDPLLLNWEKIKGNPVKSPAGDSCIWKEGPTYFGLVGADCLVSSKNLLDWTVHGGFLEASPFPLGDAGACPGFVPIGDKHLLVSFSHTMGGQYLLGDYDIQSHKFKPYAGGRFNHGSVSPGGVHAPSAAADGKGGVININNINDAKPSPDWDQIMSLPQQLTLAPDSQLRIEPVTECASLRGSRGHVGETVLPANQEVVLDAIRGNTVELEAEIDPQMSRWVQLNVLRSPQAEEQTSITFFNFDRKLSIWYDTKAVVCLDGSRSSNLADVWLRPPERASVERGGAFVKLRVFIDRSVVEVFVNGKQYLAMRVYPGREDSVGVSLRAQGQDAVLKRLDAWQMQSIWPKSA